MLWLLLREHAPAWLDGPAVRACLAAAVSCAATLVLGPPIIRRLAALNVRERTEKTPIEDKRLLQGIARKSGTPTMGGLVVLAGLASGCLAWADLSRPEVPAALGCAMTMGVLGCADDLGKLLVPGRAARGLKVRHKLLAQAAVGLVLGLWVARRGLPPSMARSLIPGPWAVVFFPLWASLVVASMSNATNVTDGLDGLLAGLAALASVSLAGACWAAGSAAAVGRLAAAPVSGAGELSVFCAAMAGACTGFLVFNRHPARVFMGDTGSMALGGGLAAAALLSGQELVLAVAGLVFVAEFFSSVLQVVSFHLLHRRMLPVAPVHHVFQLGGHAEPRIVRGFYLAGMFAALAAVCAIGR
jgi:phospho-N-acetylmuramoyl-pentapeptide-transferase